MPAPTQLLLLTTKLRRPAVPRSAVPRPALIARLNDGLAASRPLTLIVAPADYGKTTLAAAWLHALAGRGGGLLRPDARAGVGAGSVRRAGQPHEGWIAGLQLAALSLQGMDGDAAADFIADFSGSHRYIMDYLLEEVLTSAGPFAARQRAGGAGCVRARLPACTAP